MANWGSCDFRELKELNERIQRAASQQQMDKFYIDLQDDMMNALERAVKHRTPRYTGHLRRSWQRTKSVRKGKNYEATIYNNVEYAPWVENGHRTRLNRKTGERRWVKGRYMLRRSVLEYQRKAPAHIKIKSEEFLRKMMGGAERD